MRNKATSRSMAFDINSAQVNIATNTVPGIAQNYLITDLIGNSSYYFKLWTQDTGGGFSDASNMAEAYILPNPPQELLFDSISSSTVAASWSAGNNSLPVEYSVLVDTDAIEPIVSSSPFQDSFERSFEFTDLIPNTTYLFYGLAKNPDTDSLSEKVYMGNALTLAALPGALVSSQVYISSFTLAWGINSNPAGTEYYVEVSTNIDYSSLYGESGWIVSWEYTFSGLLEATTYYARVKARNSAGVETGFTGLGNIKTGITDVMAPITEIMFSEPKYGAEPIYISSLTTMALEVSDDAAVLGDKLGTAEISYYSVDSDTFTVYGGTFSIVSEGLHFINFYSVDMAGNIEAVKTSSVTADNGAPTVSLDISTPIYSLNNIDYVSDLSTVAIKAADAYSGIRELYYEINGSTYSVLADSKTLDLSEGVYTISYRADDNLGNAGEINISSVTVDTSAPISDFEIIGSSDTDSLGNLVIAIDSKINLISDDPLINGVASGMKEIFFSIDGGVLSVYENVPISLSQGLHKIEYYGEDNVSNIESKKALEVFVGAMPEIAIWSGLGGDGNWHNPDNWRNNEIPGANDNAVLATRDTVYVSSDSPALEIYNLELGDEEGLSAPILMISTGVISNGKWTINKNAILIQNTLEPYLKTKKNTFEFTELI